MLKKTNKKINLSNFQLVNKLKIKNQYNSTYKIL